MLARPPKRLSRKARRRKLALERLKSRQMLSATPIGFDMAAEAPAQCVDSPPIAGSNAAVGKTAAPPQSAQIGELSGGPNAHSGGGPVVVTGSWKNDVVIIIDNGLGDFVINLNGNITPVSDPDKIVVDTKGGNDTVIYRLTSGDGPPQRVGGKVETFRLEVDLGNGGDRFYARLDGSIVNRTIEMDVDGGAGRDHLVMPGAEEGLTTNIAENSTLKVNFRGASGKDLVWCDYKGELNGLFQLSVDGGKQKDELHVKTKRLAGSSGDLAFQSGGFEKSEVDLG